MSFFPGPPTLDDVGLFLRVIFFAILYCVVIKFCILDDKCEHVWVPEIPPYVVCQRCGKRKVKK